MRLGSHMNDSGSLIKPRKYGQTGAAQPLPFGSFVEKQLSAQAGEGGKVVTVRGKPEKGRSAQQCTTTKG